jgi:ribulose-5-phosphate 4-epimerase/fuculose-1-phosphate aldolase
MAAVFRYCAQMGWNEQIANHNSHHAAEAAPGRESRTFLINPRGWRFEELTASSLIVCDLDGNVIRGNGELRTVAFHIHARIHVANPAATCVLHVHPQYLTALSMLREARVGARPLTTTLVLQRPRRLRHRSATAAPTAARRATASPACIGDKTILDHGPVTASPSSAPTSRSAFDELYFAERTLMYQMTAMNTGRKLKSLPDDTRAALERPLGREARRPHAPERRPPRPRPPRARLQDLIQPTAPPPSAAETAAPPP